VDAEGKAGMFYRK